MKLVTTIILVFFVGISSTSAIAQWTNISNALLGPYSTQYGGVLASTEGIVYAGYQKLFKSVDSGRSWTATNLNTGGNTILDVCFFDKLNGAAAVEGQGVYLTGDGGNSWNLILIQLDCMAVAFLRNQNEIIAADRNNGGKIHCTSDGGLTWHTTRIEEIGGGVYHLQTRRDGTAYALSRSIDPSRESHISESTDFGMTWFRHQGAVDLDSYSFILDSCDTHRMYVMNESYNEIKDGFSKVFRSTDRGDNFDVVLQKPANFFSASGTSTSNASYAASSASNGVFRTTDHGDSWQSIGGPFMHQDSRLLTAINDNIIFAADEQGNIWRTLNSGGSPVTGPSNGTTINFSISSERIINDTIGATIYLPIYLKSNQQVPSFNMVVHFPTYSITYLRSVSLSGNTIDIPGEQWNGRAKIHFDAADLAARKDSLIGFCIFQWMPFEYDCLHITFDSMQAVASDISCSGLPVLAVVASEGIIGSNKSCGVSAAVDISEPEQLLSFRPNPAAEFGLLAASDYSGFLTIKFVNEVGVIIKSQNININAAVPEVLDLQALPEGLCYIMVSCDKFSKVISFIHLK